MKKKRKINKVNVFALIVSIAACLALIAVAIGLVVIVSMLKDKPTLLVSDFTNSESSIVYDYQGAEIAELGVTIRENVSYEDLPDCLINAFVAVEDSRYFEHNGFDVPRFAKAFLSNLRTMSFSQGGSTFTMQLIKNTYFSNDETGQQASRSGLDGIRRKVQEIALAMELENSNIVNKKTIFELYLNKLNFGGSRNIRGVEKASEYYFGKEVSQLNLSESALLAGVINAPNAYNPFVSLEKATYRRNEVLYQMYYHGYISEEEYELEKTVKIENLLVDGSARNTSSNGVAVPYQAYIDQVVAEVYELTGKDPYTTGMRIYTYMNTEVQSLMDSIQNGTYDAIVFPDDEFELASIAVNNQTGAIVGILGGRNYADGGSLLLNHAVDQYKQPGSSIKPILDYALAFENLGWSTSHVLVDKPIVYPGTNVVISNSNGTYQGQVTLKDALGNSLNTPAIQTLQAVLDVKGASYVVNYLNNMGINIALQDFDVQCVIGGNRLQVSCLQMAGAQGALINGGLYTTPHTVYRIEFLDGKAPITPTYVSEQNLSQEAAYMISTLLESNVSGGYANLMQILIDNYPVYAKTGTTDWADAGVSYGIPIGAIKDAWMIGSTTEYTVATWIGYEKAQKDKQSYITLSSYLSNIQGKTTNAILDQTVREYGRPKALVKPDGVVSISHILATYPYASPIDGMKEEYITTGFIKKEFANLVNPEEAKVLESIDADPKVEYHAGELTIEWPEYKDPDAFKVAEDTMDISLKRGDGSVITEATGKRLFDYSWVYGPVRYKAEIKIKENKTEIYTASVSSENNKETFEINAIGGQEITACAYYAYENVNTSSSQRCVSISVEDKDIKVNIPSSSVNQAYNYLDNLGATVSISQASSDQSHSVGTFTVKDLSTNTDYIPGVEYSKKESDFYNKQFVIVQYVNGLVLTKSSNSPLQSGVNNSITIEARNTNNELIDPFWDVICNNSYGEQISSNDLNVTILDRNDGHLDLSTSGQTSNGVITVYAKYYDSTSGKDITTSVTINVKAGN